jgi:hypothetical protein
MALKGRKNNQPLVKTSIQMTVDMQAILDREAELLEISRSALIGNIVAEYYRQEPTNYPTWKGKSEK